MQFWHFPSSGASIVVLSLSLSCFPITVLNLVSLSSYSYVVPYGLCCLAHSPPPHYNYNYSYVTVPLLLRGKITRCSRYEDSSFVIVSMVKETPNHLLSSSINIILSSYVIVNGSTYLIFSASLSLSFFFFK